MPPGDRAAIGRDRFGVQRDRSAVRLDQQPRGHTVTVDVFIAGVLALRREAVGQGDLQIGIGGFDRFGKGGIALRLLALCALLLFGGHRDALGKAARGFLHRFDRLGIVRRNPGRAVHADELSRPGIIFQMRTRGVVQPGKRLGRLGRLRCFLAGGLGGLARLLRRSDLRVPRGEKRRAQFLRIAGQKEVFFLKSERFMVRILRFQERGQIGLFIICKAEARGVHGKFHAVQRHLQLIGLYGLFEQRRSLLRRLAGQVDAVQLRAVQKRTQRLRLRRGLRFLLPLAGADRQNQRKQQRHDRTASDDLSHSESSSCLFICFLIILCGFHKIKIRL